MPAGLFFFFPPSIDFFKNQREKNTGQDFPSGILIQWKLTLELRLLPGHRQKSSYILLRY